MKKVKSLDSVNLERAVLIARIACSAKLFCFRNADRKVVDRESKGCILACFSVARPKTVTIFLRRY